MQQIFAWQQSIKTWLYNFLLVQLFINLFTWPLFLGWGLPITPLSIVGNLIFSPFLTAFLLLSSLIVLCNLIALPCGMLLYFLEKLTTMWLWITRWNVPDCLITCITPPLILSLCAPIGATGIILHPKLKTTAHKVYALIVVYAALLCLFSLLPHADRTQVAYGNNTITVVYKKNKLFMIDPGFARRAHGITSWINYTLLPTLGTMFGRQTIDYVIIKNNTPTAALCAAELRKRGIAKKIIITTTTTKNS